ncbi:MAG: Gfo/Idh/MocA family oxidoreductase [Planctomycetes bacterium]|nr:Gfo/Idh/MocA family oxidoreductase [Planctomycetota bacterium]MCB9871806.1 Gfo/Idh/MocA family oxidoreductase [Planctomycetota bacterium]
MPQTCHVALIGQKFMGRAHSNAWAQVGHFFDLPLLPERSLICARDAAELRDFAARWGWQRTTTDWREVAADDTIDLVDIGTPNDMHREQAVAMLEAGKHVACEKPLAGTLDDARVMAQAAKRSKRSKTFVWFNYRRCPALALAHRLVQQGKLGTIYHVRATYLQSWGGPNVPLIWRFQRKVAGSGAHGDLNAHIVDLARFLTGDEIVEVHGAVARTFIRERALPGGGGGGKIAGQKAGVRKGKSDVDDAVLFLASFRGGAVASFEATRVAAGHQNRNTIELNGSQGSLRFDFEDMNVLHYHEGFDTSATSGWTRIMCTAAEHHPYAANWWPDAHVLGYEHGFINMAADVLRVLGGKRPEVPLPDFADAYETQRVLEAALLAAKERRAVKLSEVK